MQSASRARPRRGPSGTGAGAASPSLRQRLRYAFDNTMARGTPALIGWLAIVAGGLIALFTLLVLVGGLAPDDGEGRPGLIGQFYDSLLHTLDPGTIAGSEGDWPFLVIMLLVTLAGLLVVSALIGVVATGLDAQIQELRKGRSVVLERDHTLILGWSDTVFTILAELEIANASEKDPSAVILADRDKVEMDDLIREKVHPRRTRVITRSGSPIDLADLALASPETARSVIILSPDREEDPDAQVIKSILALTRGSQNGDRGYHIVAEIEDPANLRPAGLVGGAEAVLIDKRETVARLVVHAARQSGASIAFIELLDFGGDEIYMREDPALHGRTFGEALFAYEDCTVIGAHSGSGRIELNPPAERRIEPGEELIAIAEDDDRLAGAEPPRARPDAELIVETPLPDGRPESVLILGWNRGAPSVVNEFDKFLKPGSDLLVVADEPGARDWIDRECSEVANTKVSFSQAVPTSRETLEGLDPERFDHVIVLCDSERLDAQRADARALVTLLHLRDIAERRGAHFSIVTEILDDRDRELAEVTRVDDVIVSDKVISLMLTQISENRHLTEVFAHLFSAEGSELYLRPAASYVRPGAATTFATVVEAARRRGETALGYRHGDASGDASRAYGVRINPPKSEPVTVRDGDKVIVLAEQ